MTVEALLDRLDDVRPVRRGAVSRCPVLAHGDTTPSLAVDRGSDGRILLYCRAGCTTDEILRALGLGFGDLFPDRPHAPRHRASRSPLTEARYEVLSAARRQPGAREPVQARYEAADAIRLADRMRRSVTIETPDAWELLAMTAALDREAEALWASA
jgi:hypothetical protein